MTVPRIAVATDDGVAFIDPTARRASSTIASTGGAHGLALVTGLDDTKLYATAGEPAEPGYESSRSAATRRRTGPSIGDATRCPVPVSRVAYDAASQHGPHPRAVAPGDGPAADRGPSTSSSRTATRSTPTRACRTASCPVAWALDFNPATRPTDRQQLLVFDGDGRDGRRSTPGRTPSPGACPASSPGALTAALLYLLARILFRRRLVAVLVGLFVLARRDVLRPVADRHERRLRRAVHRRRLHGLRGDLDRLVARPRRVLAGDARHRRPARPGAGQQMGRRLRHRRARCC